jgi:hypothetical protein
VKRSVELTNATDMLVNDCKATLGSDAGRAEQVVRQEAKRVSSAEHDGGTLGWWVVNEVQPSIQAKFDTTWPPCPVHPDQPLELRRDDAPAFMWHCPIDGQVAAPLGGLLIRTAADRERLYGEVSHSITAPERWLFGWAIRRNLMNPMTRLMRFIAKYGVRGAARGFMSSGWTSLTLIWLVALPLSGLRGLGWEVLGFVLWAVFWIGLCGTCWRLFTAARAIRRHRRNLPAGVL